MNERVAYIQGVHGREVTWPEVTTEDLRVAIAQSPDSDFARFARIEWARRGLKPIDPVWGV